MQDIKGYVERLDKSMTRKEKLFFFNKVKLASYDIIVDFGCANGRLLYEIDKRVKGKAKNLKLIGIDNNDNITIDYEFTHEFLRRKTLREDLPIIESKKVLLILSSVLHEVDDSTRYDIGWFAHEYADTVVIRDMFYQCGSQFRLNREKKKATDFIENHLNLLSVAEHRIFNDIYRPTIYNGVNVKKLYEFFLKYTYKENWTTERDEKYFSKNVRWLADVLRQDKTFKLKYCKHYILPYKKRAIKQNFNYKLAINTHVKVIFERRKVKE